MTADPVCRSDLAVRATFFSASWYRTFLDPIDGAQTRTELDFVERHLPLAIYPALLDVCCGPGRHALPLAARGYRVVGLDTDDDSIRRVRALAGPRAEFLLRDMRRLDELSQVFDGALNLWHSFGFFDDATNARIVRSVLERLRPRGRAIFDIYNREHMRRLPAEEAGERNGVRFRTLRSWAGDRFRVEIRYEAGGQDRFEWRLYSPDEFTELCTASGFSVLASCAWFTESRPPSADHARMQFVLQR